MQIISNKNITSTKVLVIGSNGEKIGEMKTEKAIELAYKEDLDLVQMSVNGDISVCKILDVKKYIYDQKQKEKQQKKNQKNVELKEVRISFNIADNDLNTKEKSILRMIKAGYEVKVVLVGRGREVSYMKEKIVILDNIVEHLKEDTIVKTKVKIDGRRAFLVLAKK